MTQFNIITNYKARRWCLMLYSVCTSLSIANLLLDFFTDLDQKKHFVAMILSMLLYQFFLFAVQSTNTRGCCGKTKHQHIYDVLYKRKNITSKVQGG
jgi:hypothetical protein